MGVVMTSDIDAVAAAVFTEFRVNFNQAFAAAQNVNKIDRLAMEVPSTTYQEVYTWFGTVPVMREFKDERTFDSLISEAYTVVNKDFAAGMELSRNVIADDRYNMLLPKVRQMAQEAQRFPTQLAMQVLAAGETGLCYDKTPFFGTTHVDYAGQGTQTNLLTGSGVTLTAVRTDIVAARTVGKRFFDQQGRPLNLTFDLVVAPPELEDVFKQLLNTNMIALSTGTQQDNVLRGEFDLMIDPYLADTNDWYLLNTKDEIKPLLHQVREAPSFDSQDQPTADVAFVRRKYRYGVFARFNVAYGLWQNAIKVKNA